MRSGGRASARPPFETLKPGTAAEGGVVRGRWADSRGMTRDLWLDIRTFAGPMTPGEFRARREAMGLTHAAFAAHLGVAVMDVIRCERAPRHDPFLLELAVAYVELRVEAERRRWTRRQHAASADAMFPLAAAAAQ